MRAAFVLDCSIAMAWCFTDERTQATEALKEELVRSSALVPWLWNMEVCNALLVAERRKRLDPALSDAFIELLEALPLEVDQSGTSLGVAGLISIGRRHGLTAYDAVYLELAIRSGLPLATLDEALRRAAEAAGVELLGK